MLLLCFLVGLDLDVHTFGNSIHLNTLSPQKKYFHHLVNGEGFPSDREILWLKYLTPSFQGLLNLNLQFVFILQMSSDCCLLPVGCRWQMAEERQVQDEHSSSLPSHWKEVQISESQGKFVQKLELTSLVQLQSVLPSGKIYTWLAETCWQFWLKVAHFDTIVIW